MAYNMTAAEKAEVFATARALGISATALYREYADVRPNRVRREVARESFGESMFQARRMVKDIDRAAVIRCAEALKAARVRREYKAARGILAELRGSGLVIASNSGRKITVSAVTDRRGNVEAVAVINVIRKGVYGVRLMSAGVVVGEAVTMTHTELIETLTEALPARIDSVPAKFRDSLRYKSGRAVTDTTGERATPGSVQGAERDSIAGKSHRESMQGLRNVSDEHKAESNRLRVARYRAKQRAARMAADGRTHALRPAAVETVGEAALTAPRTVTVFAERDTVAAERAAKATEREAAKIAAANDAFRAANPELFPEAEAAEAAAAADYATEAEALTLF